MNPGEQDRRLVYEYDRGSNYEQDTRLTAALSALLSEDELVHPDQRLFQIAHLVTEYAWCGMQFEMRRTVQALREGDYLLAAQLLERAAALGKLPVQALSVLTEFLPQRSLLLMRETFPENTTGLDSPGARNLRRAAAALWDEMAAALAREGLTLEGLIAAQGRPATPPGAAPAAAPALVRQMLLRLDTVVAEWKQLHLRLVWSQLGGHPESGGSIEPARPSAERANDSKHLPKSLRGQSTAGVRAMAERSLFPRIWDSVDTTYRAATSAAPTDPADLADPAEPVTEHRS
jgi:hypothetical protein